MSDLIVEEPIKLGASARSKALKAFGERLRSLRVAAGLYQRDIEERLDVAEQTVRDWEAGRNEPVAGHKRQLAELYGLTIEELIGLDEVERLAGRIRELPTEYQTMVGRLVDDLADVIQSENGLPRAREESHG